jgi:hypothetical protein
MRIATTKTATLIFNGNARSERIKAALTPISTDSWGSLAKTWLHTALRINPEAKHNIRYRAAINAALQSTAPATKVLVTHPKVKDVAQ